MFKIEVEEVKKMRHHHPDLANARALINLKNIRKIKTPEIGVKVESVSRSLIVLLLEALIELMLKVLVHLQTEVENQWIKGISTLKKIKREDIVKIKIEMMLQAHFWKVLNSNSPCRNSIKRVQMVLLFNWSIRIDNLHSSLTKLNRTSSSFRRMLKIINMKLDVLKMS